MIRRLWILGLLATSCGNPQFEAFPWDREPNRPIDLRANLSVDEAPLMADVVLYLDLYRDADLELEFDPAVPDGFRGGFDPPVSQPLNDGVWERRVLRMRPVRTGTLTIAPFSLQLETGETAATSELMLEVTSLLAEAEEGIEAPAPPFPSPFPWQRWGLTALAVLIAATACFFFWYRRRRLPSTADSVPVPPHAKALRELARLREAPRRTPGEIEAFYVAVSSVLRVYIEERFGLHAPERTTEEFLAEVEAGGSLLAEHRFALRQFLEQCDLVKFAAVCPESARQDETLGVAEQFVESTRQDRIQEGAA